MHFPDGNVIQSCTDREQPSRTRRMKLESIYTPKNDQADYESRLVEMGIIIAYTSYT